VAVFDIAHPQEQLDVVGLWKLVGVSPHAVNANKPAASTRSRKSQRQKRPSRPDEETRMISSFIPVQQKTDSAGLTKKTVTRVLRVLGIWATQTPDWIFA
jgi:hypothetical protein